MIEKFLLEPELSHVSQALVVGGRAVELDVETLQRGAHILVCTPGRIEDLLAERKQLNLAGRVKELVRIIIS